MFCQNFRWIWVQRWYEVCKLQGLTWVTLNYVWGVFILWMMYRLSLLKSFEIFMLCIYTQNMILKISRFSIPLLGFTKIILCSKFEISKFWAAHTAIRNLGGMHYDSDFGDDGVLHFGSIFILAEVYLQNFSMIEVGTFWK